MAGAAAPAEVYVIILQGPRARLATVPFLLRASDCVDEAGVFALGYSRRLSGELGRPAVKRRADVRGRMLLTPVGSPPLGIVAGHVALMLDPARVNLIARSEEFDSTSWVKTAGISASPNVVRGPDGALNGDRISNDTGVGFGVVRPSASLGFGSDGEKSASVFLRAGSAAATDVSIYDQVLLQHRHQVRVAWNAGVPSLSTISGSGVLYPPESWADLWWRIMFSANGILAANENRFLLYPVSTAAVVGDVFALGAQAEDTVVPSSYILTRASTAARSADSLYFELPALNPPRALTVYVRSVNRGQYAADGITTRVAHLGAQNIATNPRLSLFSQSNGAPGSQFDDGTSNRLSLLGVVPALGQVVEHRVTLAANGSVQTGASIGGGAEVVGTASVAGPMPEAFAGTRLYLAGFSSGNTPSAPTHVVVAEGVQAMDTLRALAGVG